MARYFYGNSEFQGGGGDGLQTLILMNPAYVGYSDNQPPPPQPANFEFLNSNSSENAVDLPHALQSQRQHLVGVPLQGSAVESQHHQDAPGFQGFLPRVQYNLYNQNADMAAAREGRRDQQGLSLSLSSQQPPPGYGSFVPDRDVAPSGTVVSPPRAQDRVPAGSPSGSGVNGMTSVMLSSKYLKAAQELLDEVVSVGKGSAEPSSNQGGGNKRSGESTVSGGAEDGKGGGAERSTVKRGDELTTAEKQEIQMKKAKLVNMLDEVEQRYRQYHHQMLIVISWFEQASRVGSAKTYTALALQTISKQFRCLKDAILGQIRTASKNLGEEDALAGKAEGSRLKYVDNQIRQQRALQQLGMIQHNAWRPQRGLPERSVTVLRAWLFEHFLHPYPKDSDKVILAKQTGLTRSQVSNWFINARVRLWKPMVEEMYMEEMKGLETNAPEDKNNSPSTQDSISKSTAPPPKSTIPENHNNKTFISKQDHNPIPRITSPMAGRFDLIGSSTKIENITPLSPKKTRNNAENSHSFPSMNMDSNPTNSHNDHMSMKFTLMGTPTNFIGGFGSYPIGELGRYESDQFQAPYSGNGVSLTLGLPHCENNLSMGGTHPTFLPSQGMQLGRGGVEIGDSNDFNGMNTPTSAHSTNVYESMNIHQNRKRFASELLPDYVA